MSELQTYYEMLQVDSAAEREVIDAAYRRLARKYHPDLNDSPGAAVRMSALNKAYATLSNASRRAIYDRELRKKRFGERYPELGSHRGSPTIGSPTDLRQYAIATDVVKRETIRAIRTWSTTWTETLPSILCGDDASRGRATEAGQRCVEQLTTCLTQWESLSPPEAASRLNDLGGACLRLELALVRGTLNLAEGLDYSVLRPLAGLSERISGLTRTIAAEELMLAQANAAMDSQGASR